MIKVGFVISEWLKTERLSQTNFGKRLNISQPRVCLLLKQDVMASDIAIRMSKEFGFSLNFLLTGEGTLFDNDESLIVEEAKEYLDATASGDAESADYWKQKYDAAVLELQAERGKVEGLRIALESLRTAAIPHAQEPRKKDA